MTMRIAVAISGRGSNLEALLRALGPGAPAEIVLVVSDRAEAAGLAHARRRNIPAQVLPDRTTRRVAQAAAACNVSTSWCWPAI